jgi:hypothetical protein
VESKSFGAMAYGRVECLSSELPTTQSQSKHMKF